MMPCAECGNTKGTPLQGANGVIEVVCVRCGAPTELQKWLGGKAFHCHGDCDLCALTDSCRRFRALHGRCRGCP
jgi:hypothetical protein